MDMDQSTERRNASRVRVATSILCDLKLSDRQHEGMLRDMSLTGIYMELAEELQVDEKCEVDIILQGENSRLKIEGLQGRIARCDSEGVALRFDARMEWFAMVSIYFCNHRIR